MTCSHLPDRLGGYTTWGSPKRGGYNNILPPMKRYILSNSEYDMTLGLPTGILLGHYVYIWLDSGTPFYIGTGTARRAYKPHPHSPKADSIRSSSHNFKVRIESHMLSKPVAHMKERFLIESYSSLGFKLCQRKKERRNTQR